MKGVMMRRSKNNDLPYLLIPRDEARQKIQDRIDKGKQLYARPIRSESDLELSRDERRKWSSYNVELLKRIFDNRSIADEYERFYGAVLPLNPSFSYIVDDFKKGMQDSISRLESIINRLELIPENQSIQPDHKSQGEPQMASNNVFIVHGHDTETRESVARFIEKLGLHAVILHEQPNRGRTIIEKIEQHSEVGYALVLLTPDDIGAPIDKPELSKPRARQNVVFELGFFCGALSRRNVCTIYKEGVELPTDYLGVGYTKLDSSGAWKMEVARELKAAGFKVDLNRAV
jgi:predicted nucleotide-binding protein